MKIINIVGLLVASLFFFIASFIDGAFNLPFFSVAISLITLAFLCLFKQYKTKKTH